MSLHTKLDRAHTHLDALDEVWDKFLETKPYGSVIQQEAGAGAYTRRARIYKPLPPEIVGIVGDTVANLRDALDHLAYALCAKNKGAKLRERDTRFPILKNGDTFRTTGTSPVSQMSVTMRAEIERLQPYLGRHGYDRHPLGMLENLVQVDKHRYHLTVGCIAHSAKSTIGDGREGDGSKVEVMLPITAAPFVHDTILASFKIIPPDSNRDPEMQVKVDPFFFVAFGIKGPLGGSPVRQTLHGIYDHIRDIVFPKLEPFLV